MWRAGCWTGAPAVPPGGAIWTCAVRPWATMPSHCSLRGGLRACCRGRTHGWRPRPVHRMPGVGAAHVRHAVRGPAASPRGPVFPRWCSRGVRPRRARGARRHHHHSAGHPAHRVGSRVTHPLDRPGPPPLLHSGPRIIKKVVPSFLGPQLGRVVYEFHRKVGGRYGTLAAPSVGPFRPAPGSYGGSSERSGGPCSG